MSPDGLSTRQQAFVEELLVDGDPINAALRAGYHPDQVAEQVRVLMFEPLVTGAIDISKAQRAARTAMTKESVLHEMSFISHSNIAHYIVDDLGNVALAAGAPEGAMRAIKSIKKKRIERVSKDGERTVTYDVEISLWDKPTPLKLMGRQVGLFPDKVEHSGPGGGPIETVSRIERVIVDDKEGPALGV